MAKKQTVDPNLFAKTEPAPSVEEDPVRAVGIGLKGSEWSRLEAIAGELGVRRNMLVAWILRDFIKRYDSGWRPDTEPKRVLRI